MLRKITFDCLSLNCKLRSVSTLHIGFLLLKLKVASILVKVALLETFLLSCSLIIHIVHPFNKNIGLSMVSHFTIQSNSLAI